VNNIYKNKNIVCIWYPTGGFGHFVNAIVSLYGKNFVRPNTLDFSFSKFGDAHDLNLVAPKFSNNTNNYDFDFSITDSTYSVLIDNGIDNESKNFIGTFPNAKIIKLCYSTLTWPIVASTMIHKVMRLPIETALMVDNNSWPSVEPWCQREKYFLFLKDHKFRNMWKPDLNCHNIFVDDLIEYKQFYQSLNNTDFQVSDFYSLWKSWAATNKKYIQPLQDAIKILQAVDQGHYIKLHDYSNVWTQAIVNYLIWCKYNVIVGANDYANWFVDTLEIQKLINHAQNSTT